MIVDCVKYYLRQIYGFDYDGYEVFEIIEVPAIIADRANIIGHMFPIEPFEWRGPQYCVIKWSDVCHAEFDSLEEFEIIVAGIIGDIAAIGSSI